MPTPKEVFDNPSPHWSFLVSPSDETFEGQYFDRKQAGRSDRVTPLSSSDLRAIRDEIATTVSAFANENRTGGLLVVGISKAGEVKGLHHLGEGQINALCSLDDMLRNQTASCRLHDCTNSQGDPDKVILIYVPPCEAGICETISSPPRAWRRSGSQNLPLNEQAREQIRRDKKLVDFERSRCCTFEHSLVDTDVVQEFRKVFLAESTRELSDEQLLFEAGALIHEGDSYAFNNAGILFFTARPQRELPWAHIRLLRFEGASSSENARGLPTFDRTFDGPLPQQIRRLRAFFRESGFFKTYQRRSPSGGFVDEPEFPPIAIDEGIVNAVAHRDYGIQLPIECTHYGDAFMVENPGRVIQRDRDLPTHFSLETTALNSMPRNPKLIEWLKLMRDEEGASFVRAISEGTKRMHSEMRTLGLPAPTYFSNHARTRVTLRSNATEREALLRGVGQGPPHTAFVNLFPIRYLGAAHASPVAPDPHLLLKDLNSVLADALRANSWYIDEIRFGRVIAHRQGLAIPVPLQVTSILQLFPAYSLQFRSYWARPYLSIDYLLQVKNVRSVHQLLREGIPLDLRGRTAVARTSTWQRGRILDVDPEFTRIRLFDLDREEAVPSNRVIPDLPIRLLFEALERSGVSFDLAREIKRHSLSLEPGASRTRAEKTIATAQDLSASVFPLKIADLDVLLDPTPEPLHDRPLAGAFSLSILSEPAVEFSKGRETPDIRAGITKFGAYQDSKKIVELVPICADDMRSHMATLIERLKAGKHRYSGSERTFSTRFTYSSVIVTPSPEAALSQCQRLIAEHPEWEANPALDRLFLVHTPERGHRLDDESSPYYLVKRHLLERGIPCQMVDTPTLLDPDWKDLNLALNIVAKCGITPWVLPNRIPDADFFVGLSYTQSRKQGAQRLLGYATVFNQFGRWEFYTGNTEAFTYEERTKYFGQLVKDTLTRLPLHDNPAIYFHYSAKFSHEDREAILAASQSIRPHGTYSFVSINTHHNHRLYDSRPEADGSLARGAYIATAPFRILLSTTGYNPYRKSLGSPLPLEATIWISTPEGTPLPRPDLKALAVQLLSLTKLNWASTDSICGEPITTKFAGDIAYLTDAFLRKHEGFRLHPVLEQTPWFI